MLITLMRFTLAMIIALPAYALDDEDTVVWVKSDDPEFIDAYQAARASFAAFEEIYYQHSDAGFYLSVKVNIGNGDDSEYVWLSPFELADGQVTGQIANEPLMPGFAYGDTISRPSEQIYDWLALGEEYLLGGFTLKLSYQRMSAAEQAEFDQFMPQLKYSMEQ